MDKSIYFCLDINDKTLRKGCYYSFKHSFTMKKVTITLFAVLFAAVIALFIIVLTNGANSKTDTTAVARNNSDSTAEGVAYFDIDSVVFHFNMYTDLANALIDKQSQAENRLNNEGQKYQTNVEDYQNKVTKGLVTRATASAMETDLYSQQEALVNLSNQLQSELSEEEAVMNNRVISYIADYLEEHRADFNYKFIFAKSFGGMLFYADEGEDITQKLIEGINAKYATEK